MSLNGLATFARNLDTLMQSEAWRQADEAQRLELGYRLFNSKYGKGRFGKVHDLEADTLRPSTERIAAPHE